MSPPMLSKSRYLNGLQCPKLLWVATNEPERIPEPDAATQHRFGQGHLVGELAQELFPGGVNVPAEDFMANVAVTKELLNQRRPLFEAGVMSGQTYARADVLSPADSGEWDIVEVKSSTSVKEINYHDVAFQKLCWEKNGLKIRKCFLACINSQYVRHGEIEPKELFTIHDISGQLTEAIDGMEDRVTRMLDIISLSTCPEADIGPQCSDPYPCPLEECWDNLPEHNVFTLYYGGKKSHELYHNGIIDITHIPASYRLNDKQRIQCACVANGKPYVDKAGIREFLAGLRYPVYYLDFETFGTAVPLFDGTRPYQKIPFQFSLHIQETPGGRLKHHSFLAEGRQDPRSQLIASLSKLVGGSGSMIAYNKSFEQGVLKELGSTFADCAHWTESVISRLVDLIVPFRSFQYYHPSQKGSASLKSVLPAVTGLSYEAMPMASGDDASLAFLTITFENVPGDEVARVRQQLLDYCKMDTEGMVKIVERLREMAA